MPTEDTAGGGVYSARSFRERPSDDGKALTATQTQSGAVWHLERRRFMAVRIRLKRIGTKNTPAFRIVVADGRSPRDGRFIEEIGTYLPQQRENNVTLKLERAEYWLSVGAQPSETVASFIKRARKQAATPQP